MTDGTKEIPLTARCPLAVVTDGSIYKILQHGAEAYLVAESLKQFVPNKSFVYHYYYADKALPMDDWPDTSPSRRDLSLRKYPWSVEVLENPLPRYLYSITYLALATRNENIDVNAHMSNPTPVFGDIKKEFKEWQGWATKDEEWRKLHSPVQVLRWEHRFPCNQPCGREV